MNLQHIGLPSEVTQTLACDIHQGLAAVGSEQGVIKMYPIFRFGTSAREGLILGPDSTPVEHLEFLSNKGYLVSVSNTTRRLNIWSLLEMSLKATRHLEFASTFAPLHRPQAGLHFCT